MSITPRGMSIQEAYRTYAEGKFLVNRKYQRKLVWTVDEKEFLIDSIIKDLPIPLVLLAQTRDNKLELRWTTETKRHNLVYRKQVFYKRIIF